MLRAIDHTALPLGVATRGAPVQDDTEIEAVISRVSREGRGALLILPASFTGSHDEAIIGSAARHSLPAVFPWSISAEHGGLMSYGTDVNDPFRRSGAYVDRILKGAKPADLPVQLPTKFELVINLKTAKTLGVTVAPSLVATRDEVIEE